MTPTGPSHSPGTGTPSPGGGSGFQKALLLVLGAVLAVLAGWLIVHLPGEKTHPPQPPALTYEQKMERLLKRFEKEDQVPPRNDCLYTVERGENLRMIAWKIKQMYDLAEDPAEIRQGIVLENNVEDPKKIAAGSPLLIPLSQFIRPTQPPLPDYRMTDMDDPFRLADQIRLSDLTGEPPAADYDSRPKKVLYTVKDGESLYSIAEKIKTQRRLSISMVQFVQEIAYRNDIEDPKRVVAGTELEILISEERTLMAILSYEGFDRLGPMLKTVYSPIEIAGFLDKALKRYPNLPQQVFKRMLSVESGGQNLAVSPVGAAGLMQIMPLTARRLGLRIYNEKGYIFPEDIGQRGAWALYSRYAKEIQQLAKENPQKLMKLDDRFNPQKNINAAARYMSRLVEEYGVEGAVAAYNGGHRGLAANKPRETRAYLRLVLR